MLVEGTIDLQERKNEREREKEREKERKKERKERKIGRKIERKKERKKERKNSFIIRSGQFTNNNFNNTKTERTHTASGDSVEIL